MRLLVVALCACAVSARLGAEPLSTGTCTTFSCSTWADLTTCLANSTGSVSIQPCQAGNVCNCQTGKCVPAAPLAPQPGWPGEPCGQSFPCAYGQCNSGICVGVQVGGICRSSDNCDPGLFCNSNLVCQPLLAFNSAGCADDFGCMYGSFCNKTYTSQTGTCVQMGKVPLGGYVADCKSGQSWMCSTSTCQVVDLDMNLGYCSPALLSTTPVPTGCSGNSMCIGTDGVNFYQGSCVCGLNMLGNSFCTPFLGDVAGVTYRMTMNLAYSRAMRCNTYRRYMDACFNATGTLGRVKAAKFGYFNYPLLQENPSCVKMVFTGDYWLNFGLVLKSTAALVASSFL